MTMNNTQTPAGQVLGAADGSGFTPGPWDAPEKRTPATGEGYNFSDGDFWVFPPLGESGPVAVASRAEDARLIAAAPEMYALLKRLADWSRKYPRGRVHSFREKVDEQLIEIEEAAKVLVDSQNTD